MDEGNANTPLFIVFIFTILVIILIPWTLYALYIKQKTSINTDWDLSERRKNYIQRLSSYISTSDLFLILAWIIAFYLLFIIKASQKDFDLFDPFQILGVNEESSESEIKKAYFSLAKKYHPDKNPNPVENKYFTEYIVKAYEALTDPISKENYKKYGHPDGPQGIGLGIALPKWLFSNDPKVLLLLVFLFILSPLAIMSFYLFQSNKYIGTNNIIHDTLAIYTYSKYCVKPSQSISRIPETLVCAKEFFSLHTPPEHQLPCEELRNKFLRFYPEFRNKQAFWKRKTSIVKTHMLLLMHLAREYRSIPQLLKKDYNFVVRKCIPLLEEIVKIACLPRKPNGYGWLTPSLGTIQLIQCITQAVPISFRNSLINSKVNLDSSASLLQLPGVTQDSLETFNKNKIYKITDLFKISKNERNSLFQNIGINLYDIKGIEVALENYPQLHVKIECFVEGEDQISEGDIISCKISLILRRYKHNENYKNNILNSKVSKCFCPYYDGNRFEKWYLIIANPNSNNIISIKHVSLNEAEASSLKFSKEWNDDIFEKLSEDERISLKCQTEILKFLSFNEGNYGYHLFCLSDCWIGCHKIIPINFTVKKRVKINIDINSKVEEKVVKGDNNWQENEELFVINDNENDSDPEKSINKTFEEDYDYDSDESGELETDSDNLSNNS